MSEHSIGDTVASIIAPAERYGRVAGRLNNPRRKRRWLVREFADGDRGWPSGDYQYKTSDAIVPWVPEVDA